MRSLYISMIVFSCMNTPIGAVIKGNNPHDQPTKQETSEERENRRRKEEFHRDLAIQVAPAAVHAIAQPLGIFLCIAFDRYKTATFGFLTALFGAGTYYTFEPDNHCGKYAKGLSSLTTAFFVYLTLAELKKQHVEQEHQEELKRRKRIEQRKQEKWAQHEHERQHHHGGHPCCTA